VEDLTMNAETPVDPVSGGDPSSLRRHLSGVTVLMNNIGTVIIVLGMLLACGDVAARNLFNAPFFGVPELMKMTIVAIVFLQLPHAVITGRMIRSDVFLDSLPAAPRRAINTFHMVCGALFLAAVAVGVWPQLVEAIKYNLFVGVWVGFRAPVWPIRTIIVAGAVFGCVAYILNAAVGERRA
jgi:TRAP-type C4-dicarboxylate transport system permease small subunit